MSGNNTRSVLALVAAMLLLASGIATIGLQSGATDYNASALELDEIEGGDLIVNYIYEIELENNDNPRIELDDNAVLQEESFTINGTNFDPESEAGLSIFDEQLLALIQDGETAERSAAVLLTKSNLTISEDDGDLIVENSGDGTSTEDGDGTIILATNISPTDASGEYDVSLECETGPDGDEVSTSFDEQLVIDDESSKQFLELSLAAGEYEECQVILSPSDDDDPDLESTTVDLTVMEDDDSETSTASIEEETDGEGAFMQDVTVASDAETGRYVLMAETANDTDDSVTRAIASLTIIDEETTTAGAGNGVTDVSNENGRQGGSNNGSTGNNNGNPGGNDNNSNPPTPPDGGSGGGEYEDPCTDVDSDSDNVNNTIVQSVSQSAHNNFTDNDVINVVQKIHGTYNGTGHLNTDIAIDDSDTVTQEVVQDVDQDATIKKCPDGGQEYEGNQTNLVDLNATQVASNAYSDNTVIIIVQTVIIPKYCNTDVNAPISISDRDTVTQTIEQDVDQEGVIAYGGSGDGSNTVTEISMEVKHNNETNDEVITINQVIIVPPDCPVEIQAPIVIEGDDNVQMTVVQSESQDESIESGAGVTIESSVSSSGQPYTTNTVVTVASQDGQNYFYDDDTITIEQNVYYVNDTTGWNETNYEENLAEEFGNDTTNSTLPVTSNSTEGAGDNSTDMVDNSTSAEDSFMTFAASEQQEIVVEDNSTDDKEPESSEPPLEEGTNVEESPPPSPGNSTDAGGEESLVEEPPAEETEEEQQPPETTKQETGEEVEETVVEETTDEQPPAEEPASDPPTEETPPVETNSTDTDPAPVVEDAEPVESQDMPGNSTSTA